MSKPNKLSRGRSRKKATQPTTTTTSLNDSSDDFSSLTSQNLRPDSQVEVVVAARKVNRENYFKGTVIPRKFPGISDNWNVEDDRKKRLSNIFEDDDASKPSTTVSATPPSSPRPPPQPSVKAVPSLCPLCSKHALPGHLKSCGIRLGLTTQQVVELRRMEERHREDRRKLGVPEVAVTVVQEKSSKVRVTRRKAGEEGEGADPDLALALALSISAAASVGSGGGGEMQERVEPTEVHEKMWLPQAQVTLKRRGKRVVGQTMLQSRTEEERERIIGEKVAKLLEGEMGKERAPDQMERTDGRKGNVCRKGEESNHYWSLAANLDSIDTAHLMAGKLEHFLQLENCKSSSPPPPPPSSSTPFILPAPQPASQASSLAALSYKWLALLQSAQASDMTILCKEEVPCHSLVLTVRCPLMMKSVVREGSGQMFLVMDQYEHTVVKVVLHYLYGGVLNTGDILEREQLVQLRKMVTQYKMKELNSLIGELEIEEVDEDEEEVASSEDFADDRIFCGTQSLDVLLECIDNESQENDNVDGDEWEEVCEYKTQRNKSVASEEGEDEIVEKIDDLMHDEEHEVMTVISNVDTTNIESEPELSLRLEESFKSDTSCKLTSVEKLREPSHLQGERSSFIQEGKVSLCRVEPSYSCPTENVPTVSSFTSKLSVVSRSSSPDMFDMSDEDTEVTHVPSTSQHVIQTGVKRKSLSHSPTTPSPHKRPCPDYSSDSLATPAKYTVSPAYTYSGKIVDLTQSSPPDSHVGQIESPPPHVLSPSSTISSHHISISSPSPPIHTIEVHDDGLDNFEEQKIEYYKSPDMSVDPLHPNAPLPSTDSSPLVIVPLTPPPIVSSADAEPLPSCAVSQPPPPNEPPDNSPSSLSEAELVSLLTSLSSLLTDEDSTPSSLVSALIKLATLPVTVPVLLSTGVGKVVRRLKDMEGKVGRLAGKLVSRWKRIVLQYEPPPSTAVCQTRSYEGAGQVIVSEEVISESGGVNTEGYEVDINNTNDHKNEQVNSRYIPGEDDQNSNLNLPPIPKFHLGSKSSHSVLEQTGLGSPNSGHLDQEEFDLPDCGDVNIRSHSVLEKTGLASQHTEHHQEEPIDYDLPDRGDVWDDFDEDVVCLGTEHVDNFALAEASEMWTSDNDPAAQLVTHPTSHPTPVRSISEPLPRSPVFSPWPIPAVSSHSAPVTPLPDYHTMITPHLKAELKKFGLKAVPLRKACLLLNHIYDQTHPLVPSTPLPPANKRLYKPAWKSITRPDLTPASQLEEDEEESDSTCSQDSQVPDMPEESILHDQEDLEDITPSQVPASDSLHNQLSQFLHSRPSLVQSVLLYQPLWLGQLARDIKEASIKCKVAQLQDWLDIHCITFRTESSRNRNKAVKEPANKKSTKQKESEEVLTRQDLV